MFFPSSFSIFSWNSENRDKIVSTKSQQERNIDFGRWSAKMQYLACNEIEKPHTNDDIDRRRTTSFRWKVIATGTTTTKIKTNNVRHVRSTCANWIRKDCGSSWTLPRTNIVFPFNALRAETRRLTQNTPSRARKKEERWKECIAVECSQHKLHQTVGSNDHYELRQKMPTREIQHERMRAWKSEKERKCPADEFSALMKVTHMFRVSIRHCIECRSHFFFSFLLV